MTKVAITSRFATTSDVLRVHRISPIRQAWLDKQLSEIVVHGLNGGKKVSGAKTVRSSSKREATASTSAGRLGRRGSAPLKSKSGSAPKRRAIKRSSAAKKR